MVCAYIDDVLVSTNFVLKYRLNASYKSLQRSIFMYLLLIPLPLFFVEISMMRLDGTLKTNWY